MSLPVPSLWGSSFIGNWYIPVLNQKNIETTPPPSNNYDSTVHVFVSYTMVQMFALYL